MAKCNKCGKSGLFLKLQFGICNDCAAIGRRRVEIEKLEDREKSAASNLADLNAQLSDQQALYDSVVTKAKEEGIAQALASIKAEQEAAEQNLHDLKLQIDASQALLNDVQAEEEKTRKTLTSAVRKIEKQRPLLRAIQNAIDTYDGK